MRIPAALRQTLRTALPLLTLSSSAFGLIKFNDGHDEIFVTGTAGVAYDSNLYASADGEGDTSYVGSLEIEYRRKAGMLGVNGLLAWNIARFESLSNENFADPLMQAELTKDSGRTTGALKVSAQRQHRAETAINLRTASWNYESELNVRYPVIERYSIAGVFGYSRRDFHENAVLVDIDTASAGADLQYALNSERNLIAGYRFRRTDTTADTRDRDHAFTVGVNGRILPKLEGSLRGGLQQRSIDRRGAPDESHATATANASATWTVSGRLSVIGEVSKDFVTVATDASVDTTLAGLTAQYGVNAKTAAFAGVRVGKLEFLDTGSRGRKDTYATFDLGATYTLNEHAKFSAGYSYLKNWSTLAFSDFDRHTISLSLASRW